MNNTYLGKSLAASGPYVLAGAPDNGKGEVYLFDAHTGEELYNLTASDEHPGARFGCSVALSGERAVIGAQGHDAQGFASGAVYVFDTRTGAELYERIPSDVESFDSFGVDVALSGDRFLVGSSGDDDNGIHAGAAYLFDLESGDQLAKILASDGAPEDRFASRFALNGTRAVISAAGDDDHGPASGSAYVFDFPQSTGRAYCFGDGSAGACPCGNVGAADVGCASSLGVGARLVAAGSESASSDALVLHASSLPPSCTAELLVATDLLQSPLALPFGDGLRCAGAGLARVGRTVSGPTGDAFFGAGLNTELGPWFAGDARRFQVWFTDPVGPCGAGYNATNAVEVTFGP